MWPQGEDSDRELLWQLHLKLSSHRQNYKLFSPAADCSKAEIGKYLDFLLFGPHQNKVPENRNVINF